jgi:SAM-dependent methyltransferase
VTAVDGSAAFVGRLGPRLAAAPGGPHRALRGDMGALPVPDASAGLAVCAEVLEHLDDDAAAAAELHRALRPGGALVVTVPAGPYRYDWTDRWAGHRRRYTAEGLAGLLDGAGFAEVTVLGWGFPLTGLYHRWVYRPMLRRRLERGAEGLGGGPPPLVGRVVRAGLEVDSLFTGRRPGWFGLIATARRPPADG